MQTGCELAARYLLSTSFRLTNTEDFARPVAVVQLPFRTKGQIHGNWVDVVPGQGGLARRYDGEVKVSGRGALEKEE